MKKSIVLFICILFFLGSMAMAEEMSFEKFVNLVAKDVVPDGFTQNKSRTFDMKSSFHVEFTGDESKMEMISITIFPRKYEFSELDKIRKPESYKYKDRPALYTDGNKAGMASYSLILNGKKGTLSINHRVFGGKFLDKAGFEKMVEKIGLDNLEK